jgi:hypothetical protein
VAPPTEMVTLAARLRASGLSSYAVADVIGVSQRTAVNYWNRFDGEAEPLTLAEWGDLVRDRPCGGAFPRPPTTAAGDPVALAALQACQVCPLRGDTQMGWRLKGPCATVAVHAPDRPRHVIVGGWRF